MEESLPCKKNKKTTVILTHIALCYYVYYRNKYMYIVIHYTFS